MRRCSKQCPTILLQMAKDAPKGDCQGMTGVGGGALRAGTNAASRCSKSTPRLLPQRRDRSGFHVERERLRFMLLEMRARVRGATNEKMQAQRSCSTKSAEPMRRQQPNPLIDAREPGHHTEVLNPGLRIQMHNQGAHGDRTAKTLDGNPLLRPRLKPTLQIEWDK